VASTDGCGKPDRRADPPPPSWARSQTVTPHELVAVDGELAAILRRAQALGIPAWRVLVALGVPLPQD
jgi:hypothetical protein